jgi:hypothetical protein
MPDNGICSGFSSEVLAWLPGQRKLEHFLVPGEYPE